MIGAAVVVGACGSEPLAIETDPDLVTGSWTLVRFVTESGRVETPAVVVSMMADIEGFRGVAGPNHFGGAYDAAEEGAFLVTDLVSTDIGGPQAEIAQRYLLALGDASRYGVNARDLLVYTTSGAILVFRRDVAEPT